MASSQFISEEDLHAFVDGETDAQTNGVILAYLQGSPADAARVETWRTQNELIRAGFAKIAHEPIPLSLSLTPTRNRRADTLVQFAPIGTAHQPESLSPPSLKNGDVAKLCAAIGIAFAVGMIAALMTPHFSSPLETLFPSRTASISSSVTSHALPSQTLEIALLREKGELGKEPEGRGNILPKLFSGDFNSAPLLLRNVAELEVSITGFQIGTKASDPELCLFLTNKAKEPLTLCSRKAGSPENVLYHLAESPPFRSVDWTEKTSHLALVGRLSEKALLDLAQSIHARIEVTEKNR